MAYSLWSQKYLRSKIYRMFDKVHARRSVHTWKKYQATPAYVKTGCQNNIKIQKTLISCVHGREIGNQHSTGELR